MNSNKVQFNCNVCFGNEILNLEGNADFLTQCGCFFCKQCMIYLYNEKIDKPKCPSCSKPFEIKRTLDLNRPEHVKSVEFIFHNPESQFKKVFETMKV